MLFDHVERRLSGGIVVESFQLYFGFLVLYANGIESLTDATQGKLVVVLIFGSALVLAGTVVLDALTGVLDFGKTESCR